MRGDDAPAFRAARPGLHLAPDLAWPGVAIEQRRRHTEVAAVRRDHGSRPLAPKAARRARAAKRRDLGMPVEVLANAIADGARVVTEQAVERRDIVRHQRLLVAL